MHHFGPTLLCWIRVWTVFICGPECSLPPSWPPASPLAWPGRQEAAFRMLACRAFRHAERRCRTGKKGPTSWYALCPGPGLSPPKKVHSTQCIQAPDRARLALAGVFAARRKHRKIEDETDRSLGEGNGL